MSLNNNQNETIKDDKEKYIKIKDENKIEGENKEDNNDNELNIEKGMNYLNENIDSNEKNLIKKENTKKDENPEVNINSENNNESPNEADNNKNNNEITKATSSEISQTQINIQIPENTYMTSIDIIKKNYCMYDLDNSFSIFKLKNGHLYIVYPLLNSFLCFDLIDEVLISTIKNAHDFYVLNFRYLYDSFTKRDLIQTISGEDNNLKLWDVETWECLIDINANQFGIMFSACFLYDDIEKQNFLVSSNCTGNNYIQVFDFKGKKIKDVPYHEESEKHSDDEEDNFHNDNNNESNDNINFGNNSEDNDIHNENNNNEFNNSENNNEEKSDDENNDINPYNNNNFNKNEEIQDNKSRNSDDINNEKNKIINVYNNNDNINDEKETENIINKNEENKINEDRDIEKDENINIINKDNNFIYKRFIDQYNEEENNINNDIKNNQKLKEEDKDNILNADNFNKEEKSNIEEKYEEKKDIYNSDINLNFNIINNNIQINDNDINLKENNPNHKPNMNDEKENSIKNNLDEENVNNANENLIINEEENSEDKIIENDINTNSKENNNDNDNSNHSINENENSNDEEINNITHNKKPPIDHIYYIDSYFDKNARTTYIISCCSECVKSFNYNLNTLYHIYQENVKEKFIHGNVIIDDSAQNNNLVKLIETCNDGYVRIWDFHLGDLLNKIKICDEGIKSICLWDENNIFVGCDDTTIKMVNINNNEITHILYGHKQRVCCLKKIEHEKYGKCLISKGWGGDFIKLWKKKE